MFLHIDYAVRVNVVMCKEVKPISCFSKDIKILIFPYSETAMELLFKFYPSGQDDFSREEANGLDGCLKIIFWLVIQVKRTFLSIILMISILQLPSFERISIAFILVVISESHQWYCICNMKTVV